MPVEHIVFFRVKPSMTNAQWSEIHRTFMALKTQIPGILDLSFGPNISPERAQGMTHALRVLFTDEASLRAYGPHPAHEALKKLLPLDRESDQPPLIAMDWMI